MMLFFTNSSFTQFLVRHQVLFCLFLVTDGFRWIQMGRFCKNIQLMLLFLKTRFLVLRFSYYRSMTFLFMLQVILSSMLMMLLSSLNVIRHLICGNNQSWFLNLNLNYETLRNRPENGFVIPMLEKLILFFFTSLITMVLLM